MTFVPVSALMHQMRIDLLHGERGEADALVVEKRFYPVGPRNNEGSVVADREVPVTVLLAEEVDPGLRLGEDLLLVGREESDYDREFTPASGPFVYDGEARMGGGEGMGGYVFKQSHQAVFAAQFLTHIITEKGKVQNWFYLCVGHDLK